MNEIFTLIGIIITALISLYVYQKQSWGKIVSESRNKWIDNFREEVSIIVSVLVTLKTNNKYCGCCQNILEAEKAKAKLLTRINTNKVRGNEYNKTFNSMLEDIQFENSYAVNFDQYQFNKIVKLILEEEWKKVKKEARGDLSNG